MAPVGVAYEDMFRAEFAYVWNSLRRLGVRPRDLEDVTHEVFLRIYRRFSDYDRTRPLRPWIFGFAFRVASEYRRLPSLRESLEEEPREAVDPSPTADEVLIQHERRVLFEAALATVPLERRAVLVLYEIDGRPVDEIAAVLELPVNTVYSRLRVGRAELGAAVRRARARQKEDAS